MPTVAETAYPRLKNQVTSRELEEVYTPTEQELSFALSQTRKGTTLLGFLVLLKTFQRLGYFVSLRTVPTSIVQHITQCAKLVCPPEAILSYENSVTKWRHIALIRDYLNILPYGAAARRILVESIFITAESDSKTPWNELKQDPGKPILKNLKALVGRLKWLSEINNYQAALANIPNVKLKYFTAEAISLNAAQMKELSAPKRYTLAASLIATNYSRTLDDLAEMFIKRMKKIHTKGKEALELYREEYQARTDRLITTFRDVIIAYSTVGKISERFKKIETVLGENSEQILSECESHLAYAGNNYYPFFKKTRYDHIDELFSYVADWKLIETHVRDMLRVILSIKAGKFTASTILRKLGTYSRKNRLYQAFSELGKIIRTGFLMEYIASEELRRTIQGALNKSESFNGFTKWIGFGSAGVIPNNNREEQRKIIKYNHLVANCLIFYNVFEITRILHDLSQSGYTIEEEIMRALSPYLTKHINRFGSYILDLHRKPPMLNYGLSLLY